MTVCRKCGSSTPPRRYVDPAGAVSETCKTCGHPRQGDPALIHDLLNRTAMQPRRPDKTCYSCGSPVLDATVCSDCFRKVKRWLRLVPELAGELDLTIAKQTRFADQAEHVTGTAVPPLPLHVEAAAARDDLRAVLVPWVKFCEEEAG